MTFQFTFLLVLAHGLRQNGLHRSRDREKLVVPFPQQRLDTCINQFLTYLDEADIFLSASDDYIFFHQLTHALRERARKEQYIRYLRMDKNMRDP